MEKKKKIAMSKNPEAGICILCGGEKMGAPAFEDAAIFLARRLRKLLGMPKHHTVACETCLPLCAGKRAAFEKRLNGSRIYAMAFVLLLIAGSVAYRGAGPWLILPAAIGAATILLLPYGYYFPKFENT